MRVLTASFLALSLSLPAASVAMAQSQPPASPPVAEADDTPLYGSQLMTPQERMDLRSRMRQARSMEEREQIRQEHHARMQARAKEQGVTLPDEQIGRAHV